MQVARFPEQKENAALKAAMQEPAGTPVQN